MKGKIKAVEGLQTKSEVSKFAIFFFFLEISFRLLYGE